MMLKMEILCSSFLFPQQGSGKSTTPEVKIMTKHDTNFFSEKLSQEERKRLDRQLRLPGWNQEALKESTVLIAGVGGLGTEIAKNLAMAGVGTLHLVDMDTIEYSNLNRQILFIDAEEGESKASAAARQLKKINPSSTYIPHPQELQSLDPVIFEEADLYISGLDNVEARKDLTRKAVHNKKPLIDGGTMTYYGHIYTYLPEITACLECDPMKERERETLAACTLVGVPRKRSHCLLKGQLFFESKFARPPNTNSKEEMEIVLEYANSLLKEHFPKESQFGLDEAVAMIDFHEPTIITVNAVIASIQSQEAVKVLHHLKGKRLGEICKEYTVYNGITGKFFYLEKPKNPKCQLCSNAAPPLVTLKVPPTLVIQNLEVLLQKKGFKPDPDQQPSLYRIDSSEMEPLTLENTLKEERVRNGETLYAMGFLQNGKDTDIYVKINYSEGK